MVVWGIVGEAGAALGGGRGVEWGEAGCERAPRPGAKASAHHAIDEVEGHHPVQATVEHLLQLGHHGLVEGVGQVGITGRYIVNPWVKPCRSPSGELSAPPWKAVMPGIAWRKARSS